MKFPDSDSFKSNEYDFDSSLFASMLILAMGLLSYLSAIGFVVIHYDLFTICGLGLLLVNFSLVYKLALKVEDKIGGDAIRTTMLLLSVMLLSFLPRSLTKIVTFILSISGFLSLLFLLILAPKRPLFTKFIVWFLFPGLLAIWITGFLYASRFHHPLYFEKMTVAATHLDQLYNASITQMINTYGISSTGLQGIPYVPYHFGSHVLLGRFSSLFDIDVLKAYNFAFPILLIPFYFRIMLLLAKDLTIAIYKQSKSLKSSGLFWLLFTVLSIGFLPNKITVDNFAMWESWLVSESYLVSLLFLFLATSAILAIAYETSKMKTTGYSILFLILVAWAAFSKISVMAVVACAVPILIVRSGHWKSPVMLIHGIAVLVITYFAIKATNPIMIGPQEIFPLHFVKTWTIEAWRPLFVPVFFLYVILYFLARLAWSEILTSRALGNAIRSKKLLDLEILLVVTLAAFVPPDILLIGGGSGYYFLDIPTRLALVFLVAWMLNRVTDDFLDQQSGPLRSSLRSFIARNAFIVMVAVLICFHNILSKFEDFINVNLNTRGTFVAMNSPRSKFYPLGNGDIYQYLKGEPQLVPDKIKEMKDMPGAVVTKNPVYQYYNWLSDTCMQIQSKKQYYVWLSKDAGFWKGANYREMAIPFILPVVTGMALINGLPENYEKIDGYGYKVYADRKGDSLKSIGGKPIRILVVTPFVRTLKELVGTTDSSGTYHLIEGVLYRGATILYSSGDEPIVKFYLNSDGNVEFETAVGRLWNSRDGWANRSTL